MKTPREILFQRHQTAESKLDTVRCEVLSAEFVRGGRRVADTASLPSLLWRELVWPCRRIWTGLAAAWIFILAVNFSIEDKSEIVAQKSSTPEMIMTWQQQERVLAELIGPNEARAAVSPKPFSPRPSSERFFETLVV